MILTCHAVTRANILTSVRSTVGYPFSFIAEQNALLPLMNFIEDPKHFVLREKFLFDNFLNFFRKSFLFIGYNTMVQFATYYFYNMCLSVTCRLPCEEYPHHQPCDYQTRKELLEKKVISHLLSKGLKRTGYLIRARACFL